MEMEDDGTLGVYQQQSGGGPQSPGDESLVTYTNLEVDDMVNQCVHAPLILSQKATPVKRSELTRLICKGNN